MIKNNLVYTDFNKHRFSLSKAEGSFLWDDAGKKYIDLTSGWNVTNLGWNHPEVNEAVAQQAKKNVYAPMWSSDPIQDELAMKLTAAMPKELDACVRATSGTEAVEESIKIARAATGRKKIVGFSDTYHGQLFASMAIGYRPEYVKEIGPLVPEFIQLEYPRGVEGKDALAPFLAQLEELLAQKDIAALITEAGIITGWGSVFLTAPGYLKAVRELTAKYGTLLIVDEVGTGFSRTGKLFAIEHEGIVPDMVTLAKGFSNGAAAIGAVVLKSALTVPAASCANLTTTFGWAPICCAAVVKTLEVHQRDRVWEQAERKGEHMMKKLKDELKDVAFVVDIRGKGLEIGVEFDAAANVYQKVIDAAFEKGLHIIGNGESVLQLMPPLTIPDGVLDEALAILVDVIKSVE